VKIRVIGTDYEVKFVKRLVGATGKFDSRSDVIRIKAGQLPLEEADTVLHELLHAIEHKMALEHNEEYVHRFATGLVTIIRDNPHFLDYLRDRLLEQPASGSPQAEPSPRS
jgi:Arc/MetJ-type ribon-helix-helix transcriptional regulator